MRRSANVEVSRDHAFAVWILLIIAAILVGLVIVLPILGERAWPRRYQPAVLRAD